MCLFAGKVGISPKEKLFTEKGTVQQILWGLRLISARQNLGVEQETPRVRKLRNDFLLAEMLYEDLNSNLMKLLFEVKQFNQATNPLTDDQIKLREELTRNIPTAKESLRRTEERMFKIGIQIQPPHEFLHFDSFERTSKYKPVRAQIALKIAEDEVLNWNMYQCTLNPEVYAAFEASLHIINEVYETEMVGENSFYSEGKYNIDEILQRRQNPLRMMMIDIAAICYRQNRIESGRGAVRTDKAARGIVMDLAIQRKILVRYFHSS